MGLWRGTPDLDAITTLAGAADAGLTTSREPETRVMVAPPAVSDVRDEPRLPAGRRLPHVLRSHGPRPAVRALDDIWCGLLAQRICRHLGYSIVAGRPHVDHRRASDPLRNLVKEAPGVEVNERLWETLSDLRFTGATPLDCMSEAGHGLSAASDAYLAGWGRRIGEWCSLFDHSPERSPDVAVAAP